MSDPQKNASERGDQVLKKMLKTPPATNKPKPDPKKKETPEK